MYVCLHTCFGSSGEQLPLEAIAHEVVQSPTPLLLQKGIHTRFALNGTQSRSALGVPKGSHLGLTFGTPVNRSWGLLREI